MANQRVNQVITPVSEAEVTSAMIEAAKELYNIDLSKDQVAILIGHNNLETNHRKAMHNYNIGNITHNKYDNWDYFLGGDQSRGADGKWHPIKLQFRSYPTLLDGVKDYLKDIHNRGKGGAWAQIMNADPVAFSKELKRTGYYEADESAYTKALLGTSNMYKKQDNYEKAKSGQYAKSQPVDTSKPYDGSQIASTYSSESLVPGATPSNTGAQPMDQINQYLSSFLSSLSEDNVNDKLIKKATYKKFLPKNDIVIRVTAVNLVDALEFARILCLAIEEETQSDSTVHTDRENVEVYCSIHGPEEISRKAIEQLSSSIADAFKLATKKIGGVNIKTKILPNKSPNYQELDIKLAELAYRQFHLKFIK